VSAGGKKAVAQARSSFLSNRATTCEPQGKRNPVRFTKQIEGDQEIAVRGLLVGFLVAVKATSTGAKARDCVWYRGTVRWYGASPLTNQVWPVLSV